MRKNRGNRTRSRLRYCLKTLGGTYASEWMKDRPTLDIPTTMPKIQIKINNGSARQLQDARAGC